MPVTDRIHEHVRKLPEAMQAEVLHFVEFLLSKAERASDEADENDWSRLSLSLAMRDMESEDGPTYTRNDLKEVFS